MTGNETKEGQEAVNEAPYRQPAGNLANEKFKLRCGVASPTRGCTVVVRYAGGIPLTDRETEARRSKLWVADQSTSKSGQDAGRRQADKRTSGKAQ